MGRNKLVFAVSLVVFLAGSLKAADYYDRTIVNPPKAIKYFSGDIHKFDNINSSTDSFRIEDSSITKVGTVDGVDVSAIPSTYLTQSSATATYLQISSATGSYLTTSSATATYLTLSSATATYLPISSATASYLTTSSATLTYLTQSSATLTYLGITAKAADSDLLDGYDYTRFVDTTTAQDISGSKTFVKLGGDIATYFHVYSTTVTHKPVLYFKKSHSDTASDVTTINGDLIGAIYFQGVEDDTFYQDSACIYVEQVDDSGTSFVPVDMYLRTSTRDSVNTNQFTLNTEGYVSIGLDSSVTYVNGVGDLYTAGEVEIDSHTYISGDLHVTGCSYFTTVCTMTVSTFTVKADGSTTDFYVDASSAVFNDLVWIGSGTNDYATAGGDLYVQDDLEVDGELIVATGIGIGTAPSGKSIRTSGACVFDGNCDITGNIRHGGDADTQIVWSGTPDKMTFNAGGEVLIDITESTQDYAKLGDGGDVDINLNDNLFIDGSNSVVYISSEASATAGYVDGLGDLYVLDELEVDGYGYFTSSVTFSSHTKVVGTLTAPAITATTIAPAVSTVTVSGYIDASDYAVTCATVNFTGSDIQAYMWYDPVSHTVEISTGLTVNGTLIGESTSYVDLISNQSIEGEKTFVDYAAFTASTTFNDNIEATGYEVFCDTVNITGVGNNIVSSGAIGFTNDVVIPSLSKLRLDGNASGNTYITESSADRIDMYAGGSVLIRADQGNSKVEILNADLEIVSGNKFYIDGGSYTYISESAPTNMSFYAGGVNFLNYITAGSGMYAHSFYPAADDTYVLGGVGSYWNGLWYGAGGLNQKPCFEDLKEDIVNVKIDNKFERLPTMATYKRKETGKVEKGFIIRDDQSNEELYEYVNEDGSLSLNKLVAQMCVCIKELKALNNELESRIEDLENQ